MKIVICGGGIMGCSTAYHLSLKGLSSTVVERCDIACAASGKAGGFLARDWSNHFELGPLSTASFDMHANLSETLPQTTDYRRLTTLQVSMREHHTTGARRRSSLPQWLDGASLVETGEMGTSETTAQVHPYKLSHAFIEEAKKRGTVVRKGVVENLKFSDDGVTVCGVVVDGEVIEADKVVIAMGPWCGQARKWLYHKIPAIEGQRAHSITLSTGDDITPHALFMDYSSSRGLSRSPEVYPRPDGETYVCGMSDSEPLPVDPAQVLPNQSSCDTLNELAGQVSKSLKDAPRKVSQACFLPISPDGLPLIGPVPGIEGAYIATGHSCWGILNSPATGLAIAELIAEGKCSSFDLSPFDPKRFKR